MEDGNDAVRLARTVRIGKAKDRTYVLGVGTSGFSQARKPRCSLILFNGKKKERDPSSLEIACKESFLSSSELINPERPYDDLAFTKCQSRA